jgi:uncharacterized protein (DUF2267 family)
MSAEQRETFLHDIQLRAPLPAHVTPEAAVSAAMCALTERLTAGEAHDLLAALPSAVRPLFSRCVRHRHGPVEKLDRAELVARVADHLGVTPVNAEAICRAVFQAVEERLSAEQARLVAHQLPRDLQELWRDTRPMGAPTESAEAARREIVGYVEENAALPLGVVAPDAISAVMCIFSERLSGGEARDLVLGLPDTVRPLLERCLLHRGEPAARFDREQFLQRIADHMGTTLWHAEQIARAVFAGVKRFLPDKEARDISSQLPPDLRALWESA